MRSVNVTELRQHLPAYLESVRQEGEIAVTLHGRTIARIVPDSDIPARDAARSRLAALRGKMIAGDVLAPLESDWTGDADHL